MEVRNRIYQTVFDQAWVQKNLPRSRTRQVALLASLLAILAFFVAGYAIYQKQLQPSLTFAEQFQTSHSPDGKITSLARLLELDARPDSQAHALYSSLSQDEKLNLFTGLSSPQNVAAELVAVIEAVYQDNENTPTGNEILGAMRTVLGQIGAAGAPSLKTEIEFWLKGREEAKEKGNALTAVSFYDSAWAESVARGHPNHSVRFDRAMALIALEEYDLAYDDLQAVWEFVRADLLFGFARRVARVAAAGDDFDQRLRFRPVFVVADVDAVLVIADRAVTVDRIRPRVIGAGVEPVANDFLLVLRHADAFVPLFDQLEQAAGPGADGVRFKVALAVRGIGQNNPVVAEQLPPGHLDVADRVQRAPVAGDVEPAFFAVVVVALQTVLVQDRLDVSQMMTGTPHETDLMKRIEGLERTVEYLKGKVLRQVSGPQPSATVEAEHFIVRDSAGKRRAELGLSSEGRAVGLRLCNQTGQDRLELTVGSDGSPILRLCDQAGNVRAGLGVTADGWTLLALFDQAEKGRAHLSVKPDGSPDLNFRDQTGKRRAEIGLTVEGGPLVALFDQAGGCAACWV